MSSAAHSGNMPFETLTDQQLTAAFRDCHGRIEALLAGGETYASLAQQIGIGTSALKQFVVRGKRNPTSVRRGAAFKKIYDFLNDLVATVVTTTAQNGQVALEDTLLPLLARLEYRQQVLLSYWAVSKILNVVAEDNEKAGKKLEGTYFCYRNGSNDNYLVKSLLRISRIESISDTPIWEFIHSHYDSNGVLKESDGMFICLAKAIYLFGDLAHGEGIDFIMLNEPLSSDFTILSGFEVSVDHNHRPFFAKVFCIKSKDAPDPNSDTAVDLTQQTGIVTKEAVLESGINGDPALGARVIEHLRLAETGGLVRINMNTAISRVLETP